MPTGTDQIDPPKVARAGLDRVARLRAERPRIAIFSPWPPKSTGVSTHAARLACALWPRYAIDIYHESGYVPNPALRSGAFGAFETREFRRRERVIGYRAVLHQMGNSFYHGFVHDAIRAIPGIVTLHDPCLSGFQFWRAHRDGDPFQNLRRLIYDHHNDQFGTLDPLLQGFTEEPGGFAAALARRGLFVNRDVLASARAVVVHSAWSLRAGGLGEFSASVIPLGASPRPVSTAIRERSRARFGLVGSDYAVGCFGLLSTEKLNVETVAAFEQALGSDRSAVLLFVGGEGDGGLARDSAVRSRVADRVRFLGMLPDRDYLRALEAVDLGICLRRPPTYGESSAALLDLLRHGVPTIVNDAGSFDDFPEGVVHKFRWDDLDGVARLVEAIRRLSGRPDERQALGRAAIAHVRATHDWPIVAGLYADLFERSAVGAA